MSDERPSVGIALMAATMPLATLPAGIAVLAFISSRPIVEVWNEGGDRKSVV
jgi:hypothetical protein